MVFSVRKVLTTLLPISYFFSDSTSAFSPQKTTCFEVKVREVSWVKMVYLLPVRSFYGCKQYNISHGYQLLFLYHLPKLQVLWLWRHYSYQCFLCDFSIRFTLVFICFLSYFVHRILHLLNSTKKSKQNKTKLA